MQRRRRIATLAGMRRAHGDSEARRGHAGWIGHQGEPWKFHPAIRGGRSGGGDSPGREAMFARPATRTEVSKRREAAAVSQRTALLPTGAGATTEWARGGCGESADSTRTFREGATAKSAAVTSRGLLKRSFRHAASPPQSASQGSNVAVRRGMNEPLPAARGGQDGRAGGSGADFRKSWIGHQGEPWKFHPAIRGGRSGGGDSPGREAMFARPATRTEVSKRREANAPSQLQ